MPVLKYVSMWRGWETSAGSPLKIFESSVPVAPLRVSVTVTAGSVWPCRGASFSRCAASLGVGNGRALFHARPAIDRGSLEAIDQEHQHRCPIRDAARVGRAAARCTSHVTCMRASCCEWCARGRCSSSISSLSSSGAARLLWRASRASGCRQSLPSRTPGGSRRRCSRRLLLEACASATPRPRPST